MQLGHYVSLLHRAHVDLTAAYGEVGAAHRDEADVYIDCGKFGAQSERIARRLEPFLSRYGSVEEDEPDRLHRTLFDGTRTGPLALLRDLHDLYLMACECDISWTVVTQGAQGARDKDLLQAANECQPQTGVQMAWLRSRMKQAAPQVLVVV
jgi:hypothetical protein